MFDPTLGRFLQSDALRRAVWGENLYRYPTGPPASRTRADYG
jgi:hypothetical protein